MTLEGAEPPVFSLSVTTGADGWTTVSAAGELDLATADALVEAARSGLATGGVLIDLRELTFMDSAGVLALDTILGHAATSDHELRIVAEMHPNTAQVLQMTGMMDLLPTVDAP